MKKKLIILIIVVLTVIVSIFIFYRSKEHSIYLSKLTENQLNFECRNTNGSYSNLVASGDIIDCYLLYDESIIDTAKQINFTLETGNSLKLIDTNYKKDKNINFKKKNNQYNIKINNNGYYEQGLITFTFEVKEKPLSDELYFWIDNIYYKTNKTTVYKVNDFIKEFNIKSDDYYIYKINDEIVAKNYEDKENSNNFITNYECFEKNCEYLTYKENYILFDDGKLTLFNYNTLEKTQISNEEINQYHNYDLIVDKELVGIIVYDKNYENYGYYSNKLNDFVVKTSEKNKSIFHYKNYLILEKEENGKYNYEILNYEGKKYIPNKNDLIQYNDTKYYYFQPNYELDVLYFYDENNNILFNGEPVEYFNIINNKLILTDLEKFHIYDNSKLIYTSGNYKEIVCIVNNNVLILDDYNEIKLINTKEEIVESIYKLDENQEITYAYYNDESNEIHLYLGDNKNETDLKIIYNIITKTLKKEN